MECLTHIILKKDEQANYEVPDTFLNQWSFYELPTIYEDTFYKLHVSMTIFCRN